MYDWGDDRLKQLEMMWTRGLTARQIADTLGHGITRNAVIGKVRKLGLTVHPKLRGPEPHGGAKYARPDITQGRLENLCSWMAQADDIDRREGRMAYERYQTVLMQMAVQYGFDFQTVVAVFVATSPNNDYVGNLRSAISILDAINKGVPCEEITISTYKHCRDRAYAYAVGEVDFLTTAKGKKILSFYQNIVDPKDPEPVTIDGHMVAAWMDNAFGMRFNIVRPKDYDVVAAGVRVLASAMGMPANQVQATIWFARKRVLKVRYDPQPRLEDHADNDLWRTLQQVAELKPYPRSKT